MKKLLKQIFEKIACKHKWEIRQRTKVDLQNERGKIIEYYHRTIYICKKCGKFKYIGKA